MDFTTKLVSLTNEPLEKPIKKNGKTKLVQMTLGDACAEALLGLNESDRTENGKSKWERWQLASRILKSTKPIKITAEETAKIKERVGKMYGPVVVGPVYELLEGKE